MRKRRFRNLGVPHNLVENDHLLEPVAGAKN